MSFEQAVLNMRGGSACNFDGTPRQPSTKTNLEYNLESLAKKYGINSVAYKQISEFWIKAENEI
jgi:hypothetical protein